MDDKLLAAMISGAVGLAGIIVTSVFSVLNYFASRNKARAERAAERRKAITTALTEFYGPFLYYLDVTRALYAPFRANKPEGFRTLTYLLNPEQTYEVDGRAQRVTLSDSDHSLLKRIIETEDKMEELIRLKGGLVDDPVLISDYVPDAARTDIPIERIQKMGLLGLAITHYRVLKMAYMGDAHGPKSVDSPFRGPPSGVERPYMNPAAAVEALPWTSPCLTCSTTTLATTFS